MLFSALFSLCACSHLPDMQEVSSAALVAAKDPFTWVPAAGAAVVLAAGENQIGNSAARHTPVFGSAKQADQASSDLNIALNLAAVASSVFAPLPGTNSRQQEMASDGLALVAASGATAVAKHAINRERPDDSGNDSFPSGHTAQAFAAARVLRDNLQGYGFSARNEHWLDAGVYTAATATGWARIEAGEHHPSDVFMGAALGNFMVVWVTEALHQHWQAELPVQASMQIDALTGVPVVNLAWQF
jgi:hypothetical protein